MKEQLVLTPLEYHEQHLFNNEVRVDVLKQFVVPFTGSNVFFATTEQGRNIAIKISKKRSGAEREWIGLNKAYSSGIPTPEPLALALVKKGRLALITEKVEGKKLYRYPNEKVKYKLGQIVRLMHEHAPIEGTEWEESGKSDFAYYDRQIFQWLQGPLNELKAGSNTQVYLSKFADAMKDYCGTVSPVFAHNDIHDGQVFIRNDRDLVLIDFENWKEEGYLSELAHYLFHSVRTERPANGFSNFIKGYLGSTPLTETEKSALAFSTLFISARTVNYFHRYRHSYSENASNNHQKILKYFDKEKLWKEL